SVSSKTLPNSAPPQFDREDMEEDSDSLVSSHSPPPSDFFFVRNHVIDPQIDPDQIIFDTAIPQFASRGSPPAPPPHIAARRCTAAPTTQTPPTTTTQKPTRPWRFSSRATTTRRPETVPWWLVSLHHSRQSLPLRWTTTTTPVPTTTTTLSTTTREVEKAETKAGIHYDHTNNRTVYRYFWKPNTEEEAVIPEMIDENGQTLRMIKNQKVEADEESVTPVEEAPFEEFIPTEDPPPPPSTTAPPPPTTHSPTPRPSPSTTTPPITWSTPPLRPPPTTAAPQRPPRFEPIPEFAPRQPKIIRDPIFGLQPRPEIRPQHPTQQQPRPDRFRIATGSRTFGTPTEAAEEDEEQLPQFGPEQLPLQPRAPETQRPTSTARTTTSPSTTRTTTTSTTTTTTSLPETSATEETLPEASE
ncbi:hypothetical protein PMAYCL1PPCAC_18795, partial [Pristionchus mayeri]